MKTTSSWSRPTVYCYARNNDFWLNISRSNDPNPSIYLYPPSVVVCEIYSPWVSFSNNETEYYDGTKIRIVQAYMYIFSEATTTMFKMVHYNLWTDT